MNTDLDTYMKEEGINDAVFALKIGRHRSVVSKLRRGLLQPTLSIAAAIETQSGGRVTMQSWVATADNEQVQA
jgi:hypothetical protein